MFEIPKYQKLFLKIYKLYVNKLIMLDSTNTSNYRENILNINSLNNRNTFPFSEQETVTNKNSNTLNFIKGEGSVMMSLSFLNL